MVTKIATRNGSFIHALTQNITNGVASINVLPDLLKKVLSEGMWHIFVVQSTGEERRYRRFEEFVEAPLPYGLETTIDTLRKLCRDNNEVLSLIDEAVRNPVGVNQHDEGVDIINTLTRPTGTSKEAGLRRLRKDRPDLHEEVMQGIKSVHAACVEAGFRRPSPTKVQMARSVVEKMTPEQLEKFKVWFGSFLASRSSP